MIAIQKIKSEIIVSLNMRGVSHHDCRVVEFKKNNDIQTIVFRSPDSAKEFVFSYLGMSDLASVVNDFGHA